MVKERGRRQSGGTISLSGGGVERRGSGMEREKERTAVNSGLTVFCSD